MEGRGSLEFEDQGTTAQVRKKDTPTIRNYYEPSILPEWKNLCSHTKKSRLTRLTPENASIYAKTASCVGWKGRLDHALKHIEKDIELDENLLACLLECVITSVISLASDQVLPDEYLYCSFVYLQQIKNEFGDNPPNIAAFMEFIKTKLPQDDRETLEKMSEAELASIPSNVVITRFPK